MVKGVHITLLAPSLDHLEFILSVENNPNNWEFGTNSNKYSRQEISNFIAENQTIPNNNQQRFIVAFNGTPVGIIDLFEYVKTKVGIGVIISEKFRKKGFAEDSINTLKSYCFKHLNVDTIFCNISPDNKASLNLFEKCGFIYKNESYVNKQLVNYYECHND